MLNIAMFVIKLFIYYNIILQQNSIMMYRQSLLTLGFLMCASLHCLGMFVLNMTLLYIARIYSIVLLLNLIKR